MQVYLDLVILLNFLVDYLLLLAVNRLCGYPPGWRRCAVAALLGGLYAGACMIPGFSFLGSIFWRSVFLCLLSVLAFGWNRSTLRRGMLLVLLTMALGGIAVCIREVGFIGIILSAAGVFLLCFSGFFEITGSKRHVPVELYRDGRRFQLTALQDTGNLLCDPITGQHVLIVGPEIAWDVLGLTPGNLSDPIGLMEQGNITGLRLIPYRCIGQPGGMLLAVSFDKVLVGGVQRGNLVAFSPNSFGSRSTYQALTGGEI